LYKRYSTVLLIEYFDFFLLFSIADARSKCLLKFFSYSLEIVSKTSIFTINLIILKNFTRHASLLNFKYYNHVDF
jgi:hypothetical protein